LEEEFENLKMSQFKNLMLSNSKSFFYCSQ